MVIDRVVYKPVSINLFILHAYDVKWSSIMIINWNIIYILVVHVLWGLLSLLDNENVRACLSTFSITQTFHDHILMVIYKYT